MRVFGVNGPILGIRFRTASTRSRTFHSNMPLIRPIRSASGVPPESLDSGPLALLWGGATGTRRRGKPRPTSRTSLVSRSGLVAKRARPDRSFELHARISSLRPGKREWDRCPLPRSLGDNDQGGRREPRGGASARLPSRKHGRNLHSGGDEDDPRLLPQKCSRSMRPPPAEASQAGASS